MNDVKGLVSSEFLRKTMTQEAPASMQRLWLRTPKPPIRNRRLSLQNEAVTSAGGRGIYSGKCVVAPSWGPKDTAICTMAQEGAT